MLLDREEIDVSWHWVLFVGYAALVVGFSVVPGILMVLRGRAPDAFRYVTVGWRWVPVDFTPDETRTFGRQRIVRGVMWLCVAWVIIFWADGSAPAVLTWLVAAAAVAFFGWAFMLARQVRRLPSVVEASAQRSR
ncbi:hypothetical protein ACQEVB_22515 [Pseudonocardia sp. CA-107938]|uniref:hypothetical protein n=1 Tax=Pseudonocardia sp. CA-107938 TaxID=3240021 RepID=UPI003D92C2E3